jgi:hypothetical protein
MADVSVVDDFTRECLAFTSPPGLRVVREPKPYVEMSGRLLAYYRPL